MTSWIKRIGIALVGATLVLGTLAACGHRGDAHSGPWSEERIADMRGKAIDRISRKLELNADQQQKLGAVADAFLNARQAVKGEGPQPRDAVQAMVSGRTFDREAAQAFVQQKTQAVQATSPQLITAMADFYDSLTVAQQTEVRELMNQRRSRH